MSQINGALAQLGERYTGSVEVSGSIPLCSTKTKNLCIPMSTEVFSRFRSVHLPIQRFSFLWNKEKSCMIYSLQNGL